MSTWDDIKDTIVTAGKDVSQKAKEVSEIAKLKLDIRSKEDFVEKQYIALGTSYYAAHKNDEDSADTEQFRMITEALSEIERMKKQVLVLKGAAECPKCGAKMPEDAVFCSSCGTKMDDLFEEE